VVGFNKINVGGFTLIELLVASGLVALVTITVFGTANAEYHRYRLHSMVKEYQTIVNMNYIKEFYMGESVVDGMNTADFSIVVSSSTINSVAVGQTGGDVHKYSTLEAEVPSNVELKPYGAVTEEILDVNAIITATKMTIFSQQTDPFIDLYLAAPKMNLEQSKLNNN